MKLMFLAFLSLAFITEILCSGQGKIQFWKYEDTTGCGEGGCDFFFKNIVIKDEDGNVLHRVDETVHISGDEYHSNRGQIFFSTVEKLDEAFEVKIPTGEDILISFEAWDEDGSNDDLESTWTDLKVPFSETGVSLEWRNKSYTKMRGTNGKATFWFYYRLTSCDTYFTGLGCNSCVTNRYGQDCRTYCKPQSGFYMCSLDGDKICEERRKGDYCTDCKEQFTGENCERCAENYYPEDTCEVHCPPAPNKYYICTDQGQNQCLENRTGSECEECILNHYGEDCSKFCQETDNYKCDESGGKLCKEHFYPAEKCDINCEPELGNFTCNQTTGQKICVEGKAGNNCDVCENKNKVKRGRNEDEDEEAKKRTDSDDIYDRIEASEQAEQNGDVCVSYMNTKRANCGEIDAENSTVALNDVKVGAHAIYVNTESVKKEDMYVEAFVVVERKENLKTYENTEIVKKEDMYVEASGSRRKYDFGAYVNADRVKQEDNDGYVEASVIGRREDTKTYVNTELAEKEDMFLEASVIGRREDSKTYVNTELAKKDYVHVE